MCSHDFVKINDVQVCRKCGMTICDGGKIIFDRRFPNMKNRRKKRAVKK